jgi:hypothetical protein
MITTMDNGDKNDYHHRDNGDKNDHHHSDNGDNNDPWRY